MDKVAEHLRGLSGYNDKGEEIPDPTPMEVPIGWKAPPPIGETIRRLVHNELIKRDLEAHGLETFDEADDFDEEKDDTFDQTTPYEDEFAPDTPGLIAREQEIRSGFVEEIPSERKKKAQEVLAKHRKKDDESESPPKKKPKAKIEEESYGDDD